MLSCTSTSFYMLSHLPRVIAYLVFIWPSYHFHRKLSLCPFPLDYFPYHQSDVCLSCSHDAPIATSVRVLTCGIDSPVCVTHKALYSSQAGIITYLFFYDG